MPENATELLDRPADETSVIEAAGTQARRTETSPVEAGTGEAGEVVAADLLVEEISIDGMCGVY